MGFKPRLLCLPRWWPLRASLLSGFRGVRARLRVLGVLLGLGRMLVPAEISLPCTIKG